MDKNLAGLKPALVWKHFAEICNIPHPSGSEDKIRQYLVDFLFRHRLGMFFDTRPAYFLLLQMFFQLIVCPIGNGFEFDAFRAGSIDGSHLFLAAQIHLEMSDTFQIHLVPFTQMFCEFVAE